MIPFPRASLILSIFLILTASCAPGADAGPATPLAPTALSTAPGPTPAATDTHRQPQAGALQSPISPGTTQSPSPTSPPKSLSLCLSTEPDSLYQYRAYVSRAKYLAAEHVRQALFDGPIDTISFERRPVILESLPTLDNGGAAIETVTVKTGERYYDAAANQVTEWHDADAQMQRLAMTYTLRPGLLWADGAPLAADDSVFAFEVLAGGGYDPTMQPDYLPALAQRTASYETLDERTVRWTGLPGFVDRTALATFSTFFSPLPRHQFGGSDPTQLIANIDVTHQPIGWGPYVMTEWVVGESIALARNPRYFRAGEGLPRIESIAFRFVPDAASALTELTAGKCDAVLHDSFGRKQADLIPAIDAAAAQGALVAQYQADAAWEHLDFNIRPADDRPPFFADPAVRRAVALCLNRQDLADTVYPGHGIVAASIVPPGSPYFLADAVTQYNYDPAAGRAALAAAGWQDGDRDGIVEKENTPLKVELTLQSGTPDEKVSALMARDLSACGIGLTPRFVGVEQISGVGAQSPIFRRAFDFALFAWRGAIGGEPQCELYISSQIPTEEDNWRGSNVTGYTNADYDLACQSAREATTLAVSRAAYRETQRLLTADLPSLPLFHRLQWIVGRPGVQGLTLDGIALDDLRSELATIEEADIVR